MDAYLGGAVGGTGWVYGAALAVSAGALARVDRRGRLGGPRAGAVTAALGAALPPAPPGPPPLPGKPPKLT